MTTSITYKTCSTCKQALPLNSFSKAAGYRDGHRGQCKACRVKLNRKYPYNPAWKKTPSSPEQMWKYRIKYKFGLTPDQYQAILESQGCGCAICGAKSPGEHIDRFHIDHCHQYGNVRGLLCHKCNLALGMVGDSLQSIGRYVEYLLSVDVRMRAALPDA